MRERTSPRALLRSLRQQLPDALETLRLMPRIVNVAVRAAADGEFRLPVQSGELDSLRAEIRASARRRDRMVAAGIVWLTGLVWLVAGPWYPYAGWFAMALAVVLFIGEHRRRNASRS
jgi:hypothetical protein